jgi:hypothetical protein
MKHVLMTLLFFAGLGMSQVAAQICPPCPPGCCILVCKDAKACTPDEIAACKAAVASCTPAEIEACKTAAKACSPAGKTATTTAAAAQTPSCVPAKTVGTTGCAKHKEPASTTAPNERPVKLAAVKG